jgi:hypothetical protein
VDFDNIAGQLGGDAFVESIPRWLAWLEGGHFDSKKRKRTFLAKRMYWNKPFEHYRDAVEPYGFKVLLCAGVTARSTADMALACDGVAACYEMPRMEECVVLAIDTDYEGFIEHLSDRSKQTVIVADEGKISMEIFSECADIVIPLSALQKAFEYEGQRGVLEVWKDRIANWRSGWRQKEQQLKIAGGHLARIAKERPIGGALGRKLLLQVLAKEMKNFKTTGDGAYLSCGNYETMLEEIAKHCDDFFLHEYDHGGRALSWRPKKS